MTEAANTEVRLSLEFVESLGALVARAAPGPADGSADQGWLCGLINAGGWGALRLEPQAIGRFLADYNQGKGVDGVSIATRVDAELNLRISSDGMVAQLDIRPAAGGAAVSKADVLAELAAKGVSHGFLIEAVNAAIAAGEADAVVIARGRPPADGNNAWLERLLPQVRSRVPRVTESGQTDYRDLGDIMIVRPGDQLMRRHPPTSGEDGMTVMGTPIPAKPGKEMRFAPRLPGAATSLEDPDLLVAEIAGQPVEVKGGMIVEPVFTVERVSMASGNIRFDGSVTVRGDVSAGMSIEATGDIEIGGTAEPCRLLAGGSIVIKGGAMGAIGRKEGADCLIRCGGSFSAAYAQQLRVEAGDSIFIDDTAMQCDLTAARHVRVGDKRRGHIIGGHVLATLSITAKVLGSPNRIATLLEIGVDPGLNKRMLDLGHAREEKEKQLLDVSKLLVFAQRNPTRVTPDMLERATHTASALSAEIAALREEAQSLEQLVELALDARVYSTQRVHEGVTVSLGTQRFRVAREQAAAVIGLGQDGLGILTAEAGGGPTLNLASIVRPVTPPPGQST